MRHYTRTVPEHQRQVVNRMAADMMEDSADLRRILGAVQSTPEDSMPDISRDGIETLIRLLSRLMDQRGRL